MLQHTIWNEKYRPSVLENFISADEFKSKIDGYIKNNDIPHLIFAGQVGSGKTTIAKILAKNVDCDYLYINASDENGIDTIRDKVKSFASSASFKTLKLVILDEADFLTTPAQAILRNIIETFSLKTRFIFTCNYLERIIEPIQSRCSIYRLEPPTKAHIAKHISQILDKENIKYELKDLATIILKLYPDLRRIINQTQESCSGGKLNTMEDKMSSMYKQEIYDILSHPTKNSLREIRQIVLDNEIRDYKELYTFLYDRYFETPNIIVILAEAQYKDAFVADHEINFMAAISKILDNQKQILHG